MVKNLIYKRKFAALLGLGSLAGLTVGGGIAWWLAQQRPITGLPAASAVIPREVAATVSLSTDKGDWQPLQRFGSSEAQSLFTQNLNELRDRLLTRSGLDFQRDIQPWVGPEVTIAFLLPKPPDDPQQIQPYVPPDQIGLDQTAVSVMPIANPEAAQRFWDQIRSSTSQEWVDRDYKGVRIREVHGASERAYVLAKLDTRFMVLSKDPTAVERVIDTDKGQAALTQLPGYSQAFMQLETTAKEPLLRLYVNVPATRTLTTNNPRQPIPPLALALLQQNQGMAASMTVESDGVRLQGVSWLASESKYRHKVINAAERIPSLLPADTVLLASGGNFKEFWLEYSQPSDAPANAGMLSAASLRQGLTNLTGLDLDKDLLPWMNGEYALALISAPGTAAVPNSRAGALFLAQASDRKAADQAFQRFDSTLKDRYRFRVSQGEVAGVPVTNLVSPFSALTISRGWLDGNVAFVAVGNGVASTIAPGPETPLADDSLFQSATASNLQPDNGNFYMEVERLVTPVTNLPLPILPSDNRAFLSNIRAIGVTAAIQDPRSSRFDLHMLLRRGSDAASPAPATPTTPGSP